MTTIRAVLSAWVLVGLLSTVCAQEHHRFEADVSAMDAYKLMLPDVLLLLSEDKQAQQLRVADRLQFRPELSAEYRDFDLQKGDVIEMVDGGPVASSEDFDKIYQVAEVGQKISLGVRRKDEVLILTFPKPDPSSLPRMRIMGDPSAGERGDVTWKSEGQNRGEGTDKKKKKKEPPR